MHPSPARRDEHGALLELLAERVLDHPAVADLHGGAFGTIASTLPGTRLAGVRIDEDGDGDGDGQTVQIGVVVLLGANLPAVADDLRLRVVAVLGPVRVHVTIGDIAARSEASDAADEDNAGA